MRVTIFAAGLAVLSAGLLIQPVNEEADSPGPEAELALAAHPGSLGAPYGHASPAQRPSASHSISPTDTKRSAGSASAPDVPPEELTAVVQRLCAACHNDAAMTGNLSLQDFDVAEAAQHAETAEKMIVKLRAGMMPPPGIPRPGGDTLVALVETLETIVDEAAAAERNPGGRTFQRLNRAEYERSVEDLLGLEIDAGDWLPLDTKSANFDNIADVQMASPTVLDAYLKAASEISRLAVGDAATTSGSTTYHVPRLASQWERVEGAPMGTRGGVSVVHNFPADGDYVFTMMLHANPTGQLFGETTPFDEQLEVSIDGERVAVLEIDRWMSQSDPNGMNIKTDSIFVRAGAHRVTAAFIKTFEAPVNDKLAPVGHSIADTQIGSERAITNVAHLRNMAIVGPFDAIGVAATPTRQRIFTCRPTEPSEARPCAEEIIERLASEAYRRPVTDDDMNVLMPFYEQGAEEGGFEIGVRTVLQAILSSPHFIFRFEEPAGTLGSDEYYRISDVDLASRLSYFLWGLPPDDELVELAREGRLSEPEVLRQQTGRMLEDPRSEALATRFAAQWLRLQDLEKVHPDAIMYPEFDQQLADAMQRETELFFYSLVREDRSVLDLYTAGYTYVNEDLAEHYGIPGVTGEDFRRVEYPTDRRRGILGHGSILTLTSHANRTSPVLRGKWVMEVLLGTPPPPPPPGVPDLEETEASKDGRFLTTRERMQMHRANPVCNSCHQFMDPIGLALDNFDVTGQWRIRENGMPLDTRGTFYDGSPVESPGDLQKVLLERPIPLIRTFTENLMTYALGRRIEYYDKPAVRKVTRRAEANDYRLSSFILGVVESDAFQMMRAAPATVAEDAEAGEQR